MFSQRSRREELCHWAAGCEFCRCDWLNLCARLSLFYIVSMCWFFYFICYSNSDIKESILHLRLSFVELQHKLLTTVTDNRPLLELIREAKAEVTVEEKDIDEADLVVRFVSVHSWTDATSLCHTWVTDSYIHKVTVDMLQVDITSDSSLPEFECYTSVVIIIIIKRRHWQSRYCRKFCLGVVTD